MSWIGEAETAIGLLMLLFTPYDLISYALGAVGVLTWAYDRFIKVPREVRGEIERNRQIDLIRSEIDRLRRR
jgi:hypothetical protein